MSHSAQRLPPHCVSVLSADFALGKRRKRVSAGAGRVACPRFPDSSTRNRPAPARLSWRLSPLSYIQASRTLISGGKIQGTIAASDKVQLLKSAVQIGDVHSPTYLIEEGAYFKGFADLGRSPSANESLQMINTLPDQAIRHDTAALRLPEKESDY